MTDSHSDARHAVVIGAGIVGACSALYLQDHGFRVTIVDRLPPGEACSFGNAGSISTSASVPISVPGLLPKVPGWLLDPKGPLTIRWRFLPKLLPWLIRFIRAGNEAQLERSAAALAALHGPSMDLHTGLAKAAGVADLVRSTDYLHVYSSEAAFRAAGAEWALKAKHGARFEVLDGEGLRALEPDISTHYVRAVRIEDQGYLADPSRLVKAYVERVLERGGVRLADEVLGFDTAGRRVEAVRTTGRRLEADAVVIAAGAWSAKLTRLLGVDLPLEAERGYHVTLADAGISLGRTIMETDGKFVATPMDMGVRFAGTVELADVDAPPDYARADAVLANARRMFPGLRPEPHTRWMGCRPSLPDGVPAIGPSPRQDNVWFAFGNAHTGMVGGPMTGRLVAGMAAGQPLNIDPEPYSAARFG